MGRLKRICQIIAAVAVFGASSAHATIFDFSYSTIADEGALVSSGSGEFDATLVGSNFLISSVTGTIDGHADVALIETNHFEGNDNTIYEPGNFLSFHGVAFTVGTANYTIFRTDEGISLCINNCDTGDVTPANLTISEEVAAVPEPSTWLMMIFGFAGLGFMTYRRSSKPVLIAG